MKIIVCNNLEEASLKAALEIKEQVENKPDSVLGLATGSTPVETYKNLIKFYEECGLSFKDVKTVNLDEYIGLDGSHEQSYRQTMNESLFNHIDINQDNTYVPNGVALDIDKEAIEYEKLIDELGGQDLQLLGVGINGHIGFNEPNDKLNIYTHVEDLTQSTIDANKRFFNDESQVPRKAISMGIGSILKAKKILLLAFGSSKADAIKSLEGPEISTQFPVSLLKLHPDVTVYVDQEAGAKLSK